MKKQIIVALVAGIVVASSSAFAEDEKVGQQEFNSTPSLSFKCSHKFAKNLPASESQSTVRTSSDRKSTQAE
jgi:hypothetical protein